MLEFQDYMGELQAGRVSYDDLLMGMRHNDNPRIRQAARDELRRRQDA